MAVGSLLEVPRITVMAWIPYSTDMRMWEVENYAPSPTEDFFSWGDSGDTAFASV